MLILQLAIDGIGVGCIYALVGLAVTFVHRATNIPNFAVGGLIVWGALLYTVLTPHVGTVGGLLISTAIGVGGGLILHYGAMRFARQVTHIAAVLVTVAIATVLEGLSAQVFGPNSRTADGIFPLKAFRLGPQLTVSSSTIVLIVGGVLIFSILAIILYRSSFGRAVRAVSDDSVTSQLLGVDIRRVEIITYAMFGALCFFAGALLVPSSPLSPFDGFNLLLLTLVAVTVGGIDQPVGAAVGGLVIGIAQAIFVGELNEFYQYLFMFVLAALILTARPEGIFLARRVRVVN